MSETTNTRAAVHRLIDMVVEEVSLVDRAANKHRFLVVKRDEPMADKTDTTGSPPAASAGTPEAKGVVKMSKALGDALGIATSALQALTAAVEQLGQAQGDSDPSPLVADLADQLSEVARELSTSAGIEPNQDEPQAGEGQASEQGTEGESVYNNVRSMLSRVSELLAAASEKEAAQPPTAQSAPPSAAPPETALDFAPSEEKQSDTAAEVTKQLSSLATSLRAISEAMKDQCQRLGRLEKGVGLPNSRQAPERPAPRPEPQEVSWPLDLNRRMDRESVEKDVSFHDR